MIKEIIKKFWNYGNDCTLGFGKELFLSLLIFGLFGLSSFCSADNVDDYINLLYTGSKSFSSAGYTNVINYGDNGAGTYCIKFSSSSPQTLTMGFANGGTTAPSNLYSLYNDQYGNWICLYGNKPYLNVKLNSSSNTINYEIFKLTDLLNTNLPQPKAKVNIYDRNGYRGDITFYTGNNLYIINDLGVEEIFQLDDNTYQIYTYQTTTGYCVNNNLCPTCQNNFTLNYDYGDGTLTGYMQFTGNSGNIAIITPDTETYKITKQQNLLGYDYILKIRTNVDLNICNENGYILESSINTAYCTGNNLCPACEECEQCQSCPVIDQEYCENNFNLISPSSCPVCSGGVSNWSSLWINNIQHLGASSIYMSIPEEISRDYSYSNSGEIMEVDVEGYNVDYDYINNVVEIQKYKPTDEDFNNIVGILAQYMPIIVIFIGLLFLYKLLKKPFKSKL